MDRFDDDTLLAELREIRPEPRPDFAAELDEWAAAGFPRRDSRASAGPFAKLADHLRDLRAKSARQWMVPAVGLAITVLAVAGVVVAVSSNGGAGGNLTTSATSEEAGGAGAVETETSEVEGEEGGGAGAESAEAEGTEHSGEVLHNAQKSAATKSSESAGGRPAPAEATKGTVHAGEESSEEAAEEGSAEEEVEEPAEERSSNGLSAATGKVETRGHRDIERSASIVLGTKPGEVAGAAAKVYTAVHAANGVVLNSSVQSGRAGPTGATFSLLIPSRKLDDALAEFSKIAEVRSRHDATNDITAPTVGVTEELRDSNASIEGLLKELGSVETEAERESVEARLREERRRHASIRASLEHLHKRASMSEVSLRIVTNHGAGVVPPSKDDSGWSVGDALHDAGHILTVAAGVLLIGLAILAPIALIALIFWSLNRFRVRRLRERALG
ncbi:MAG TPA: DUF4349 domain-containing protein [Solirubrobacterales bacterium]|nr:DUF4349 domain-containing protein [Solirubrobacterales bacterium]